LSAPALANLPGERIYFGISISNTSQDTLTVDPFSPAKWIRLVGQSDVIYSSNPGTQTYELRSGGPFLPLKDFWDQKDNNGQQVAPGWYEIGYDYVVIEQTTGKRYTSTPTAWFQIADPDSAMNKNVDVNQSASSEGAEVVLKRIEMNAVETKVYTFTAPPGYTWPKDHPPADLQSLVSNSEAEYKIDGGTIKKLQSHRGQGDADGVTIIWDELEPMPVNARELIFTITQLGGVKGIWEFKVELR
jgi:hypothetical protein